MNDDDRGSAPPTEPTGAREHLFFPGDGEVAALMRQKDWSTTALGSPETWPASLVTVVRLMLASKYAMWMGWGPDLAFFYNDAYREQTLGKKHPAALGLPANEVWGEVWSQVEARVDAVVREGRSTWDSGLLLMLERNGYPEETYHTFSYSPVPGDDGATAGLFCVVVEETERAIGERRIRVLRDLAAALGGTRSRRDVHAAAATVLSGAGLDLPFFVLYDVVDGALSLATRTAAFDAALDGARTSSPPWEHEVPTASSPAKVIALAEDPGLPHGPWSRPPDEAVVVPLRYADETLGLFVAGLNPHRNRDGSTVAFAELVAGQIASGLGTAISIERERDRAERLAELDRAKTTFFSNVSHEFRTPLSLVLGPIDDLLADESLSARAREQLVVARRSGARLQRLVSTVLDFSRIEAGGAPGAAEATDLSRFTTEIVASFRAAVERASLSLVVDAPPLHAPVLVDHETWEKIVSNLVSNAFKHTFEGSIRVSVAEEREHVVLTVEDTGTGIPEADVARVFERFHRVRGARARSHEGTGIGLALVAELVRIHRGTIEVKSTVDVGTRFVVRLPLERVSDVAPRTPTLRHAGPFASEASRWGATSDAARTPHPSRSWRPPAGSIVLADDNPDMRDYVERILREQGWDVRSFTDGRAALEAVIETRPDLVVSDVMMPELDGLALVRTIANDPRVSNVPIVLLSARAGEEAAVEGLAAGAADYLVKPFSSRELVARVATHLALGRARTAEHDARARLHALFSLAPVAVSVVSGAELRYEMANERYEAMVGRRGLVGKTIREAFPELPPDAPVFRMIETVRDSGVAFGANEYEVVLERRGDGEKESVYFMFTCQPLPSEGADPTILTVAVDVTEQVLQRRRIEELAEKEGIARRQAEEASRLKDEFLTTVSHELRTPLSAILGWSAMLAREDGDRASIRKGIAVIERNARSQLRIVEDILDVSRIVRGALRVETEPVDLRAIVVDVLDSVKHSAEAKRLRMELVRSDSSHRLVADPERLRQIVWNLVENAVKFTPEGGSVRVELGQISGSLVVRVRDSGRGIAHDFLPYVFDRFRQGEGSIRRSAGGLGLGLAIVRHLVEMHGGTVTADSAGPGQGATFTVVLPVRPFTTASAARDSEVRERALPSVRARTLTGVRLLVVEDDSDSRELIELLLAAEGAIVEPAGSAEDALAKLDLFAPDVLVSDIGMPGRDGYWLMKEIKKRRPGLPAVALTAYTRREDGENARRAGFDEHLGKPVDPRRLVQAIASLRRDELSLS